MTSNGKKLPSIDKGPLLSSQILSVLDGINSRAKMSKAEDY